MKLQRNHSVVEYKPLLLTGRAAVVNRLTTLIERVDRAGNTEIEIVRVNGVD